MKLSDAILAGSMISHQAIGSFHSSSGGSCAIGSAALAIGKRVPEANSWEFLEMNFPILSVPTLMPGDSCTDNYLVVYHVIIRLNDNYGWTRERIAEWVATIEAQHPEIGQPVEPPVEQTEVLEPVSVKV